MSGDREREREEKRSEAPAANQGLDESIAVVCLRSPALLSSCGSDWRVLTVPNSSFLSL